MPQDKLSLLQPQHDYLICIDSDGCMLDNMELKHKECFCPATVNIWNLQTVSRYARECAEFVNLYSRTRGTNRFPAVIRTLELLAERPEAKARGYELPDLTPLKEWCATTPVLGAAALEEYSQSHTDLAPVLLQAAAWSREVDANIAHIVHGIGPFPGVKETIAHLSTFADIVVVSATPHEALVRELTACGIAPLVTFIAGQEMGTKAQCIRDAMTGKYDPDHVLKVGDAVSDSKAAADNGVLFFPIIPGQEAECWELLRTEAAVKVQNGSYRGDYMTERMDAFLAVLQENPPWNI